MAKRREDYRAPQMGPADVPQYRNRKMVPEKANPYELYEPRESREGPMSRKGEMDRGRGYDQPRDSNSRESGDQRNAPFRGMYGDFSYMGGRGVNAYPAQEHYPYDLTGNERGNDYERLYTDSCDRTDKNFHNNPGGFSTGQGEG